MKFLLLNDPLIFLFTAEKLCSKVTPGHQIPQRHRELPSSQSACIDAWISPVFLIKLHTWQACTGETQPHLEEPFLSRKWLRRLIHRYQSQQILHFTRWGSMIPQNILPIWWTQSEKKTQLGIMVYYGQPMVYSLMRRPCTAALPHCFPFHIG